MKQQEVFKKIGTIIKELSDQYDYLGKTKEELNDLELELFVSNAHFLANHSEVLRKLNQQNNAAKAETLKAPKEVAVKEEKYFEPVVQQIEEEIPETTAIKIAEPKEKETIDKPAETRHVTHIDLQGNGADDDFSYIRQEPEIIKHELVLDEAENWEDDDEGFLSEELTKPAQEEHIPEVKRARKEPEEPFAEKPVSETPEVKTKAAEPTEEPLTINQKISAQLNNTGARATEQLHTQTIADLKQAITLNDKLLYIKDLFNGYNLAYNEAIDILNRFTAFDEADQFLQSSYAVKNNWESKQATVDKFYALLKRRYL